MKCPCCNARMVEGIVGKGRPLNLRFVPKDHKFFVWDYADVIAHACPKCGCIQLAVDPDVLNSTVKKM